MSDTSNSPVIVQRDGGVGIVTPNRPDKRNALDLTMRGAIASAFTILEADDSVKSIVVTGNATVFAAGADLNCSWTRARKRLPTSTWAGTGPRLRKAASPSQPWAASRWARVASSP